MPTTAGCSRIHTFSFADYYDPAHMGFRALRVINEDRVAARAGLRHALAPRHGDHLLRARGRARAQGQHGDELGHPAGRRAADVGGHRRHAQRVQRLAHASSCTSCRSGSCPSSPGGKPGYEQKAFPEAERKGKLRLVASPDGRDGSVTIQQDVALYAGLLRTGEALRHALAPGRHAWVHVARGQVELGGEQLEAGDAVAVSDARGLELVRRRFVGSAAVRSRVTLA